MKPGNGQGESGKYLLAFDLADDNEWRIWQGTSHLRANRQFKGVIMAFLSALVNVEERTGKAMNISEMSAEHITDMLLGKNPMPGLPALPDETSIFAGTAERVDPLEVREQFADNFGDFFDDFFDE